MDLVVLRKAETDVRLKDDGKGVRERNAGNGKIRWEQRSVRGVYREEKQQGCLEWMIMV
jgi:hypothetical protein